MIKTAALTLLSYALAAPVLCAQQAHPPAAASSPTSAAVDRPPPTGFVIGAGDMLSVSFWRDPTMSGDVLVRPDGKISLPLLKDVTAAGSTPEQLAAALREAALKFVADPDVTVIVREIHSRRVFVVGSVPSPGMINLAGDMNVLQIIAMAGGPLEYADKEHIVISRMENGVEKRYKFNYEQVLKGKQLKQNILVQPGDTIVIR